MKCVSFALGFVSGRPVNEVLALLQEDGGYSRRKTGFPRSVYIPALAKLGVRVLDRRDTLRTTVGTWVRDIANPASTWLVRISGHLMVCRDGTIYDNEDPSGTGKSLASVARCRVTHAWKVAT
jgi:hypothetical protein